jgi:hypothetical protein
MTKTVKINQPFFGEKEFTLKEFQKRWSGPTNEIWAFLIDHGNKEERDFGKKLVEEIFPAVTEKAFNKFYEEKGKEEHVSSNKAQTT